MAATCSPYTENNKPPPEHHKIKQYKTQPWHMAPDLTDPHTTWLYLLRDGEEVKRERETLMHNVSEMRILIGIRQ